MTRKPSTTRQPASRRAVSLAASLGLAVLTATALVGCGGGDDPAAPTTTPATTVELTGTAAVGAAIGGATVTATNAAGTSVTAVTAADGKFTISIGDGAPYLLKVTDSSGKDWFSYAANAGVANITPLTTLALLDANANKPLSALASAWSSTALNADKVLEAVAKVNANLQSVMSANGVTPTSFNPFTTAFTVGSAGYDKVLDAMKVSFDCSATSCTQSIKSPSGTTLVTWNANISTAGYTVSWTGSGGTGSGSVSVSLGSCAAPKSGTYSLLVSTSVAGVASPQICIDGLPAKPANQSEFCGATDVVNALPQGVRIDACSFDGSKGSITASITTPIAISYTVGYTYVAVP